MWCPYHQNSLSKYSLDFEFNLSFKLYLIYEEIISKWNIFIHCWFFTMMIIYFQSVYNSFSFLFITLPTISNAYYPTPSDDLKKVKFQQIVLLYINYGFCSCPWSSIRLARLNVLSVLARLLKSTGILYVGSCIVFDVVQSPRKFGKILVVDYFVEKKIYI